MKISIPPTREKWLQRLARKLRPRFAKAGYKLPRGVRISVGWPAVGGATGKRLGECWDPACSEDASSHVFLSPKLAEDRVAGVLVHELLHAVMFAKHPEARDAEGRHTVKHGAKFKGGCRALGLEGKATATVPGEELERHLAHLVRQLGPYPHSVLTPKKKVRKPKKVRLLVCRCEPRREFRGKEADLKGPKVECSGCGSKMRVVKKVVKPAED